MVWLVEQGITEVEVNKVGRVKMRDKMALIIIPHVTGKITSMIKHTNISQIIISVPTYSA